MGRLVYVREVRCPSSLFLQRALTAAIRIVRPNPDSRAHQQVAAADTTEDPAVAGLAAGTVVVVAAAAAWEEAAAAAKFTSPTSVGSLSYMNL